jgi:D-beta-D-heptose 7-phosphate kinase / D-beta-D-heptose 1-phosphate adenosyltransferase
VTGPGISHVRALAQALPGLDIDQLEDWGHQLARRLTVGARLLVAGNGGSAAEAQHLTSELIGRYVRERSPLSAIALAADSSTVTALGNDYGLEEVFARQVRAHGRSGDILLLISASGRSLNVLAAAETGRALGLDVWALTGRGPNPLSQVSSAAVCVDTEVVATIQECHLVAIHIVCAAVDDGIAANSRESDSPNGQQATPVPIAGQRAARQLVVIGDLLLDEDMQGTVERLSPEGPFPVLSCAVTKQRPGGAGLAALMAAVEPEWSVTLISAIGRDGAGRRVRALLDDAGVEVFDIATDGSTPVKTRIRSAGRTLVRVDIDHDPLQLGKVPEGVVERLATATVVLVCDYGRGVAADSAIRRAIETAAEHCPVVWDPHAKGPVPVDGVVLAVPNADEAKALSGADDGRDLAGDIQHGLALLDKWPVRQIAVTRGPHGAVLLASGQGHPLVIPTRSVAGGDTCGAGDRFAVAAALALGFGQLPSEAVAAGVAAATAYVDADGPAGLFDMRGAHTVHPESVLGLVQRVRAAGGRIVGAGGCFDLLHTGHISLLQQARQLGDLLIVCMNSDSSVVRLKGPSRPVTGERERAVLLEALACVDGVLVFDEDTPERILAELRPDIWVKGGDYADQYVPETPLVESWGGQVVVVPYLKGRSTTSVIARTVQMGGAR